MSFGAHAVNAVADLAVSLAPVPSGVSPTIDGARARTEDRGRRAFGAMVAAGEYLNTHSTLEIAQDVQSGIDSANRAIGDWGRAMFVDQRVDAAVTAGEVGFGILEVVATGGAAAGARTAARGSATAARVATAAREGAEVATDTARAMGRGRAAAHAEATAVRETIERTTVEASDGARTMSQQVQSPRRVQNVQQQAPRSLEAPSANPNPTAARQVAESRSPAEFPDGHPYAGQVSPGGTGDAFAGHGELRTLSTWPSRTTVPDGVTITMPRDGVKLPDVVGRYMEAGDWDGLARHLEANPHHWERVEGMQSYVPGAQVDNYTLLAPDRLHILEQSMTVSVPTTLDDIFGAFAGTGRNLCWAACTVKRVK